VPATLYYGAKSARHAANAGATPEYKVEAGSRWDYNTRFLCLSDSVPRSAEVDQPGCRQLTGWLP